MVAFIIEGAIRDDDVWWVSFGFVSSLLLRANHYQRQLTCRLPNFIFLDDFFAIGGHVFSSDMVSRFWAFQVVDFVTRIVVSLEGV
jgi:hypothetical protein